MGEGARRRGGRRGHIGRDSFVSMLSCRKRKAGVVAIRVIDNRGKKHDEWEIGARNLPGDENEFPGDDDF